jgi:hypothetical protein
MRGLRFLSTTMIFGSPGTVTLSELALETFVPADAETMQAVRRLAGTGHQLAVARDIAYDGRYGSPDGEGLLERLQPRQA